LLGVGAETYRNFKRNLGRKVAARHVVNNPPANQFSLSFDAVEVVECSGSLTGDHGSTSQRCGLLLSRLAPGQSPGKPNCKGLRLQRAATTKSPTSFVP